MATEIQTPRPDRHDRDRALALLEKHEGWLALSDTVPIDHFCGGSLERGPKYPVFETGPLIPMPDLEIMIPALSAAMQPANREELAGAAALLASAWPLAWQRIDDQTASAFVQQLTEEMSRFSGDVLLNAVKALRRSNRFAPSISEVIEAAEEQASRCRSRLKLASQHEAEHKRRAQACLGAGTDTAITTTDPWPIPHRPSGDKPSGSWIEES